MDFLFLISLHGILISFGYFTGSRIHVYNILFVCLFAVLLAITFCVIIACTITSLANLRDSLVVLLPLSHVPSTLLFGVWTFKQCRIIFFYELTLSRALVVPYLNSLQALRTLCLVLRS